MRKIIQIAAHGPDPDQESPPAIVALCDDGSVWAMWNEHIPADQKVWCRLPDIKPDAAPDANHT